MSESKSGAPSYPKRELRVCSYCARPIVVGRKSRLLARHNKSIVPGADRCPASGTNAFNGPFSPDGSAK